VAEAVAVLVAEAVAVLVAVAPGVEVVSMVWLRWVVVVLRKSLVYAGHALAAAHAGTHHAVALSASPHFIKQLDA